MAAAGDRRDSTIEDERELLLVDDSQSPQLRSLKCQCKCNVDKLATSSGEDDGQADDSDDDSVYLGGDEGVDIYTPSSISIQVIAEHMQPLNVRTRYAEYEHGSQGFQLIVPPVAGYVHQRIYSTDSIAARYTGAGELSMLSVSSVRSLYREDPAALVIGAEQWADENLGLRRIGNFITVPLPLLPLLRCQTQTAKDYTSSAETVTDASIFSYDGAETDYSGED